MPPKRKKPAPSLRPVSSLPENACWIESDAYDRHCFAALSAGSPSLTDVTERGSTLLPYFSSLLQDLFCLLFKYNIIFYPAENVLPSASFNRALLAALQQGKLYSILRELTTLDEAKAGLCTLLLGEALLSLIKSEKAITRRNLLDLWEIKNQEDLFAQKKTELEDVETLSDGRISEEGQKLLAAAKRRLQKDLTGAQALLRQKTKQWQEDLDRIQGETSSRFQAAAIDAAKQLEDAAEEAERWGSSLGTGYRSPPGSKLELGKKLAGNEKLKKLARMLGRMKFHAPALRKKVFERSSEELFEIERGDSLSRLLPHELLTLHHAVLRKDFNRRFLDQELLQYSLRGVEQKGKGPMVVCLDGSSSMAGEKEVWSKAVTLTLLEIARRQRRLFRSICFSSEETPLQVLDINLRGHHEVEVAKVMDLAEYFPGGGTDFQRPLDAALECLKQARYKKGDIVFITDGECQVTAEWAERFRREKEKLGFSLFSILIDFGSSSLGTLKEFSDRITTVKQLTGDQAQEIFVKF